MDNNDEYRTMAHRRLCWRRYGAKFVSIRGSVKLIVVSGALIFVCGGPDLQYVLPMAVIKNINGSNYQQQLKIKFLIFQAVGKFYYKDCHGQT